MKKLIILILCGLVSPLFAQNVIQRVEPSSWWVGMKDPSVQLLVYGKNIATYSPALTYKGVSLVKVHKTENPNYLFVDLKIAPTAVPGNVPISFTKPGQKPEQFNFKLNAREKGSAQRKSYDNADVIYLITPDRFANGNPSNDNTDDTIEKSDRSHKDGRHGGDIRGIINHLDFIRDMGYTTIWNMPLMENNQKSVTYHGYAISDFYKTDPRYGTNEEFRELSVKAKEKGLKLIMDVVLNHCGIAHWWMSDLPSKDWINFEGKFSPTSHKRETHQDIHAAQADVKNHVDGWFVPSMPDLNQRNPFMAQYLIQNTIWWIEYAGLAGLRIDTYPYSDKKFLTQWSRRMLEEYPNLNMVGEEWSLKPSIVSYWQKGKKNHDGYVSYLPSLMDFPLQNAVAEALNEDDKKYNQGLTKIYQTLAEDFLYADPDKLVVFPDNHDMSRFFTQVKENPALFKMGLAYFLTTRGVPQLYYGTEIGMTNPKSDAHGEIRGDFPGGWEGDTRNAFTGQHLTDQERDFMAFTKKILNWRKTATAVHDGKLVQFAPEKGLYVYARFNVKEKYLIVLNKNAGTEGLDPAKYGEVLKEATRLTDVLTGETFPAGGQITVPGTGFRILKVN